MESVFLLHHTYEDKDHEDIKLIGVFSTREAAEHAMLKVKNEPGFRDYPDGFEISEYEIDKPGWLEGFGEE